jgi:hypothetical protein
MIAQQVKEKVNEAVRDGPRALIERLFAAHGAALQAFFRRRIRVKPDAWFRRSAPESGGASPINIQAPQGA